MWVLYLSRFFIERLKFVPLTAVKVATAAFTEVVVNISNISSRVIAALQSYYSISVVVTVAAAISMEVMVAAS